MESHKAKRLYTTLHRGIIWCHDVLLGGWTKQHEMKHFWVARLVAIIFHGGTLYNKTKWHNEIPLRPAIRQYTISQRQTLWHNMILRNRAQWPDFTRYNKAARQYQILQDAMAMRYAITCHEMAGRHDTGHDATVGQYVTHPSTTIWRGITRLIITARHVWTLPRGKTLLHQTVSHGRTTPDWTKRYGIIRWDEMAGRDGTGLFAVE